MLRFTTKKQPEREIDLWTIAERYLNVCGICRIRANWKAIVKKLLRMTCFFDNNEQHAEMYGKNREARKHRKQQFWRSDRNHHKEPISTEHLLGKQIAMVLGLSRSQVKSLLEKGEIEFQ